MITVAAPRAPLVEEIPACRMLSVNPYLACDIRCVYCITGAQGQSRPRFGAETVREELQQELAAKGHRQPLVGLGTLCDAYPSVEVELGVTRVVLDELTRLGWPVRVVTKGVGVRRDVDLLLRGDGHVTVSLSTLDGNAAARLEPGAPTPAERLEVVHELADAGVRVWVSVTPWVPGVTDITSVAHSVGSTIPIRVAPLNVNSPEVKRTGFGRRFDQREIDRAYIEERERSTELTSVRWLPPVTARGPDNQEQVMIPLEAPTGCSTQTRGYTRDVPTASSVRATSRPGYWSSWYRPASRRHSPTPTGSSRSCDAGA